MMTPLPPGSVSLPGIPNHLVFLLARRCGGKVRSSLPALRALSGKMVGWIGLDRRQKRRETPAMSKLSGKMVGWIGLDRLRKCRVEVAIGR